ncbi:Heavy metal transport/detoxification protein [Solidesulfovibrio carbinoliphilus subsp. oakridgensis]|uniref:Heavy metal transport/detoxification protein n=1 Tax=Solidesulfovibrio carbinoliphilus subsp. oakridgensis TaxID=694327 RepID=G7QDT5_9BACT|nr:heavy metal-associated domain-containing protein [Solidesulfovibrio carbinoliphilus]EHJ46591.1 Heavy metal transport/detoxification protein [Solidesulfovibrio carbinoliphilus subsp. oakridgensis]
MKTVEVGGMHCPKCVASVTKALSEVPGLSNVSVSLEKGLATFEGDASEDAIKTAIDRIGFVPGQVK